MPRTSRPPLWAGTTIAPPSAATSGSCTRGSSMDGVQVHASLPFCAPAHLLRPGAQRPASGMDRPSDRAAMGRAGACRSRRKRPRSEEIAAVTSTTTTTARTKSRRGRAKKNSTTSTQIPIASMTRIPSRAPSSPIAPEILRESISELAQPVRWGAGLPTPRHMSVWVRRRLQLLPAGPRQRGHRFSPQDAGATGRYRVPLEEDGAGAIEFRETAFGFYRGEQAS